MIGLILAGSAALVLVGGYGVHRYRRARNQRRRYHDRHYGESIAGGVIDGVGDVLFIDTLTSGTNASAAPSDAFTGLGGDFGGGGASGSWLPEFSMPDISLPDIDFDIDLDL